jgi:hypothetical protein
MCFRHFSPLISCCATHQKTSVAPLRRLSSSHCSSFDPRYAWSNDSADDCRLAQGEGVFSVVVVAKSAASAARRKCCLRRKNGVLPNNKDRILVACILLRSSLPFHICGGGFGFKRRHHRRRRISARQVEGIVRSHHHNPDAGRRRPAGLRNQRHLGPACARERVLLQGLWGSEGRGRCCCRHRCAGAGGGRRRVCVGRSQDVVRPPAGEVRRDGQAQGDQGGPVDARAGAQGGQGAGRVGSQNLAKGAGGRQGRSCRRSGPRWSSCEHA